MKVLRLNKYAYVNVVTVGPVVVKQYIGTFTNFNLASMAATGKWYTIVQGCPLACQGEGDTPFDAVKDAIARTTERMQRMKTAVDTLEHNLAGFENVDTTIGK